MIPHDPQDYTKRQPHQKHKWVWSETISDGGRRPHVWWCEVCGVRRPPPDANPRSPFADLEAENARLRRAIEDFILWWDMPPFALDDDERLRVEVDALRAALDPSKVT